MTTLRLLLRLLLVEAATQLLQATSPISLAFLPRMLVPRRGAALRRLRLTRRPMSAYIRTAIPILRRPAMRFGKGLQSGPVCRGRRRTRRAASRTMKRVFRKVG